MLSDRLVAQRAKLLNLPNLTARVLLEAKHEHVFWVLKEAIEPITEEVKAFKSSDFRARSVKERPENEDEEEPVARATGKLGKDQISPK